MTTAVHSLSPGAAALPLAATSGGTPEMRMLVLMVQAQLVQGDVAKTSVSLSEQQLKELREQVSEALEKARDAEESSGFMGAIGDVLGGDIATLAGVIMIAAAAVVTGGAAALVLATIAIGCTLASKYSEELGIPPKVAIGLGIAAAVATVASGNVGGLTNAAGAATASGAAAGSSAAGAGAASAGTAAASAGAAAGSLGSAGHASRLTQIAREVHFYAKLVGPAASGGGAIAHTAAGYYHSKAADHHADAEAVRSKETLASMDIDTAIDLFERIVDRQLSATHQALSTVQTTQHGTDLIIRSFQGAA